MTPFEPDALPAWKRASFKLLKKPFFGRFARPWRWPSNARPEDYERFEVKNRHGGRLRGLVRATMSGAPKGVLVLAHPMGAAAKGFFIRYGHVELFTRAGFHCVLFDFNGFGESESTSFEYPDDLLAVATWAKQRFVGLPLAAVGASFGAMRALEAAAHPACAFRVIVAESAASSLGEFWKHYPLPHALLELLTHLNPEGERRLRPEARIREYHPGRSVLLIHSAADPYTPPSHGDIIARAAPAHVHVERLVLPSGEHTHALRDDREAYQTAVLSFLDRALGGGAHQTLPMPTR